MSPTAEKFITHWGEMGTRWGINRTMAQVHALLYLSDKPLAADEIQETLGVARSNVSNCLKELQGWGIVHMQHVLGDRRDHFTTEKDVWQLYSTILEERKKREIDPTLAMLKDCLAELEQNPEQDPGVHQRLKDMHDFMTTMVSWYQIFRSLPQNMVVKAMKLVSALR